jgi:hypothetical protein
MYRIFPPFKYIDLYLIWIVLLLFNFNIYGLYSINYISILAALYLIICVKTYKLKAIIYFLLIFSVSFLGFARSGGYFEPFKYVFGFFQIYIFYNYFLTRLASREIVVKESAKILNFFIFSFIIYASLTFYEFTSGDFLWFESRNYDSFLPRVNLGFGDSNSLASFLLIGILLLPTRFDLFHFITIVAGLLTFSRAYALSYLISLVTKLRFFNYNFIYFLFFILIICSISFLPYLNILNSLGVNFDFDFVINRLLFFGEEENPRLIEWLISVSSVGLLPDWSVFFYSLDPHNSLLLALNLFGLVGTVILIFTSIQSLRRIKKIIIGLPQVVNFDFVIFAFIIFNFFNSELFSVRSTAAFGIVLGLLVGISVRQKPVCV